MAYQINKTDGTLLTEIVDSAIDQTATDITLIGKNVSGYGEFINENFVKLLENFASETQPPNPITGQIWFDTAENRLKVYDGGSFKIGSGPIVSGTAPSSMVQGDLWIDSAENQLYFYDGTDMQLAGPLYKDSQGISGPQVETIYDTNNVARVIVKMWVGSVLIGIWSKEVLEFLPKTTIPGFTGSIGPGFNQGTLAGLKFNITATKADSLVDNSGNIVGPNAFMRTTQSTGTTGTISITNAIPLIMGITQNNEIRADASAFQIISNSSNQNFRLRVKTGSTTTDAITVATSTQKVGIFQSAPAYTLDVNGDVRIVGDLVVEGNTTTINTSNLVIEDHVIELAKNTDSTVSDNYADQGGIILKGTTDHKLTWDNATDSWQSTENFDIRGVAPRSYKINGVDVLEWTGTTYQLSSSVTKAPGINELNALTSITIGNLDVSGNEISSNNSNGDIVLNPSGTGNISASTSRIVDLADPTNPQDAVTVAYMESYVTGRPLVLSMDTTGLIDGDIAAYLDELAPYPTFAEGSQARVHCTEQNAQFTAISLSESIAPITTGDIVKYYTSVDKNGGTENQPVLEDIAISFTPFPASISVTRTTKLFQISSGVWVYNSLISGPTITP